MKLRLYSILTDLCELVRTKRFRTWFTSETRPSKSHTIYETVPFFLSATSIASSIGYSVDTSAQFLSGIKEFFEESLWCWKSYKQIQEITRRKRQIQKGFQEFKF